MMPDNPTFPNPLLIQMGQGQIKVAQFWDAQANDGGIYLRAMSETREVGPVDGDVSLKYDPQEGDVFLRFGRKESAMALRDVLVKVIEDWPNA